MTRRRTNWSERYVCGLCGKTFRSFTAKAFHTEGACAGKAGKPIPAPAKPESRP